MFLFCGIRFEVSDLNISILQFMSFFYIFFYVVLKFRALIFGPP